MVSGSRSLSESREDVISSWRFSNCSCCWTSSIRCSYNFTFYKYGTLSGLLSRALEMLSSSLAFSSRRVSTDERRVSSLRFFYHQAKENTKTSIYDWLGKIQYKVWVPTFSWIIISSSNISWITSFTIIVAMLHPAKIQFTNSLVLCYLLELLHVIYRFLEDSATDSKNTPASIALSIFCFFSSAERPLFLAMEYATRVKEILCKVISLTTHWDLFEELNQEFISRKRVSFSCLLTTASKMTNRIVATRYTIIAAWLQVLFAERTRSASKQGRCVIHSHRSWTRLTKSVNNGCMRYGNKGRK